MCGADEFVLPKLLTGDASFSRKTHSTRRTRGRRAIQQGNRQQMIERSAIG
jgi:hypothetical protein